MYIRMLITMFIMYIPIYLEVSKSCVNIFEKTYKIRRIGLICTLFDSKLDIEPPHSVAGRSNKS